MKKLGTLEVVCNAPPWPIVEACEGIAKSDGFVLFDNPKDVRWEEVTDRKNFCELHKPNSVLGPLQAFRFTYSSGDEVTYALAQCPYCKTMYWAGK